MSIISYRQLASIINKMSEEQKDMTVTLHQSDIDEFVPIVIMMAKSEDSEHRLGQPRNVLHPIMVEYMSTISLLKENIMQYEISLKCIDEMSEEDYKTFQECWDEWEGSDVSFEHCHYVFNNDYLFVTDQNGNWYRFDNDEYEELIADYGSSVRTYLDPEWYDQMLEKEDFVHLAAHVALAHGGNPTGEVENYSTTELIALIGGE
jgi:hypothetical protein